jgi:GNAT superfamily N-acetyltransferase
MSEREGEASAGSALARPEPYAGRIVRTEEFTISDKGKVIARIQIYPHRHGVIWFWSLWVDHDYQGQGLSKRLIDEALAVYWNRDIYAHIWAFDGQPMGDSDLAAFYERFGFCAVPEFPGGVVRKASAWNGAEDCP